MTEKAQVPSIAARLECGHAADPFSILRCRAVLLLNAANPAPPLAGPAGSADGGFAAALTPGQLRPACDPAEFGFETTAELEALPGLIGQTRAVDALRFGVGIRQEGYNLFVLGPAGVGKRSLVRELLARGDAGPAAAHADWCYLHNFSEPHRPRAVRLPGGRGPVLRDALAHWVDELRSAIPALFDGEAYRSKAAAIQQRFEQQQEQALKALGAEAAQQQILLLRTPAGFGFAPAQGEEVLPPAAYERLPQDQREQIDQRIDALQQKLTLLLAQIPQWWKERNAKMRQLNQDTTLATVRPGMDELSRRFADLPEILEHLQAVQRDVVERADDFRKPEETVSIAGLRLVARESFHRYQVNLLVSHADGDGPPLVTEDNPTYAHLLGRVEHIAQLGALVTDFTLIKPGALHRANGGYLLLDARKVLMQPFAWEGLKRALQSRQIRIESLGQMVSLVSTVSLEPQPVPLDVKIVLFGERWVYYLLQQVDPDFGELFKVAADFEDRIERTPDSHLQYARLMATLAVREHLLPLDRAAVARVIDHSARLAGDAQRLSTHMRSLADLLREADFWARQAGRAAMSVDHVRQAIATQIGRRDRLRVQVQEAILRGTLMIATSGRAVAQVNGLSVFDLGDFAFAQPVRITATTRLGEGEMVNIEREARLSGPVHAKGVLILSAYLAARYARDQPLALSASLVFEQSYSRVDGDSASLAELCALLSDLAGAPVRQGLAVTGSVNQLGQVQAIGAVNEKIEGFYDICAARGLDGTQGVLIPRANVKHLMLREDVVAACAERRFAVYPVDHVDGALELLTGAMTGSAPPAGAVHARVGERLARLTALRQSYSPAAQRAGHAVQAAD
ncbi:MAG: ATP-dependent protease [Rhodoferax sp.]|nr:ATP-dependent protease [Rhodoferax sp.]